MWLAALLPIVLPPTGSLPVKVWERRIAPGLVFRQEFNPNLPLVINAFRISINSPALNPIAQLAGGTVFEDNQSKGRATVSAMVKQDAALGGVNGDFFPFTGDPLNLMVRNGQVLSAPYADAAFPNAKRASFGWGPGFSAVSTSTMTVDVTEPGISPIQVDGFDEDCGPNRVVLETPATGLAIAEKPNSFVVINTGPVKWNPNAIISGQVLEVGTNLTKQAVPMEGYILIASGTAASKLSAIKPGDYLEATLHTTGFDWTKVTNVISGGPLLLRNGQVVNDWETERLTKDFSENRHPRTAIGRTANGDLWVVTIDGRTKASVGATTAEEATIMKSFGCVDAINLDGGGSTTFNLLGLTMNHPSDGVEREVANGFIIKGALPATKPMNFKVLPIGMLRIGYPVLAKLSGLNSVEAKSVIWTGSGSVWVDQAGMVHPFAPGNGTVSAYLNGTTETINVTVP